VDWLGIGLLTVCLTGMQVVLERGNDEQWFDSSMIVWWTAASAVSLIVLVFWELRSKEPVINFRVLKDRNLVLGSVMGLVFGVSLFGTTFVLPQFTQRILGYPAFESGLVLAPRALVLLLCMPVAGWAFQRVGAKPLLMAGLGIIILAYYELMQLSTTAGYLDLIPPLIIMGVGMPFMFVPLSTVSLMSVDKSQMTDASAIYTLTRRVGGNIGYSLAAVLLDRGEAIHRVYLTDHISDLSGTTQDYLARSVQALLTKGAGAAQALPLALGLLEKKVMRQATMLAYNDISFVFGCLFFVLVPMVFLMPGRATIRALTGGKKG
jgi:DHA2 family multidrug resistance protein